MTLCCRRRSARRNLTHADFVENVAEVVVNEIDADVATWFAATRPDPCPICMEVPELGDESIGYSAVSTHSWENYDRCDGHGICRTCLRRYVEIKILDDGMSNVRCPGERCAYQLLPHDIDAALVNSQHQSRAKEMYEKLRNEHGGLRLQMLLASALKNEEESWVWRECQACPRCFVLVRRETGCNHLACRCGSHFCFVCGGQLHDWDAQGCCCDEFNLHKGKGRAFLAASLSLKSIAHPALGSCCEMVREETLRQLESIYNELVVGKWQHLVLAKLDHDHWCAGKEASKRSADLRAEKVAEAWACQEVLGTQKALEVRRTCESFGAVLYHGGVDVSLIPADCLQRGGDCGAEAFEGLLVHSIALARAEEGPEEHELESPEHNKVWEKFEDEYYIGAKGQRRAAHGARRRLCSETAWVAGSKISAKAPAHPRQQKRARMVGARCQIADARYVRSLRRSMRS